MINNRASNATAPKRPGDRHRLDDSLEANQIKLQDLEDIPEYGSMIEPSQMRDRTKHKDAHNLSLARESIDSKPTIAVKESLDDQDFLKIVPANSKNDLGPQSVESSKDLARENNVALASSDDVCEIDGNGRIEIESRIDLSDSEEEQAKVEPLILTSNHDMIEQDAKAFIQLDKSMGRTG